PTDQTMRGDQSAWVDMSNFVVHLTKDTIESLGPLNLLSILASQVLIPQQPFGIARTGAPDRSSQFAVCFSEIPLHLLGRLAERRCGFGIGFEKRFVLDRGGGRIWYVEKNSVVAASIYALMDRANRGPTPSDDPIWRLTPFIDCPGDYGDTMYR